LASRIARTFTGASRVRYKARLGAGGNRYGGLLLFITLINLHLFYNKGLINGTFILIRPRRALFSAGALGVGYNFFLYLYRRGSVGAGIIIIAIVVIIVIVIIIIITSAKATAKLVGGG
jgi:tryptophan-rich sensory protein